MIYIPTQCCLEHPYVGENRIVTNNHMESCDMLETIASASWLLYHNV